MYLFTNFSKYLQSSACSMSGALDTKMKNTTWFQPSGYNLMDDMDNKHWSQHIYEIIRN